MRTQAHPLGVSDARRRAPRSRPSAGTCRRWSRHGPMPAADRVAPRERGDVTRAHRRPDHVGQQAELSVEVHAVGCHLPRRQQMESQVDVVGIDRSVIERSDRGARRPCAPAERWAARPGRPGPRSRTGSGAHAARHGRSPTGLASRRCAPRSAAQCRSERLSHTSCNGREPDVLGQVDRSEPGVEDRAVGIGDRGHAEPERRGFR